MKLVLCLLLSAGLSAFAQTDRVGTDKRVEPATQAPTMNEGEIAQVLITLNQGEIDAAKIAKKNSKNDKVKEFAKMMVDDHTKNTKDTKDLAKKAKLKLKESQMSKGLKENAAVSNKELKKAPKDGFDKAYVDEQVTMHTEALNTLEQSLLPAQLSPELRTHLEKTKQAVSEHLNHAQQLQSQIK